MKALTVETNIFHKQLFWKQQTYLVMRSIKKSNVTFLSWPPDVPLELQCWTLLIFTSKTQRKISRRVTTFMHNYVLL